MHIKKVPLREQWSLDGSFTVLLDDLVPWQDVVEVLWMPLDVGVRQVLEEVLEVLERVQVVGLGSLDDAVDGGAGFGSFRGVAEQPILATFLFVDLHGRLICMNDILLKKVLLQSRNKRHEPVLSGPDDPVGPRCTRERDANLFPFSFLSVERHGLLVLLYHDSTSFGSSGH